MTNLTQQMQFLQELEKLKAVYRQTTVKADNDRPENSAEHSWHIALVAQTLRPYAGAQVSIERVIQMLLIHDIVEVDAGDTFAFATDVDMAAQSAQELLAAQRIFGLLPAAQGQPLLALWQEFEQAQSADACFAKAMDRILPLLQNMANNGGSWARHRVSKTQVLQRNRHLQRSAPALWQYVGEQVELAVSNGWLVND
ncbi:HD domain-containing protein [uncultured Ferrimonas sp.]|uniref:HD domain-containing protein n=1 Tax=uncultured Ferrimonas sp. TaxID=432640 RepID=UPI0026107A43|nr:HD domain-containing protein [uncultured Ferrimonas sp.]